MIRNRENEKEIRKKASKNNKLAEKKIKERKKRKKRDGRNQMFKI